jgi:hypothetical protein
MHRNHSHLWSALILVLVALGISACGASSSALDTEASGDEGPATLKPVQGYEFDHIVLSAKAAQRLGIETGRVSRASSGASTASAGTVIPYAAVLYDAKGDTFTYTNPDRLTYVRSRITISRIEGDAAVLRDGPPAGTAVVTVGASELLGTEQGVE